MPFISASPNALNNNSNQKEINITEGSMSPNKINRIRILITKQTKKNNNKTKTPCEKIKCKKEIKRKDVSKNNLLKKKSGIKNEVKHINPVSNKKIIVNKSRNNNANFLLSKKTGNISYTHTEGNDFHHEKCKSLFVPFS